MKLTALYGRVSTLGQQDNYSFDNQAKDCESYVEKQADMTITHRFTEVRTGRTLDRVELQKLLTLVRNHEIDAVVVGKLDRLSRNVAQLSMIAETCHNEGVELHYADFGIDTNTSMGRMIRNMRASYAEFEADIIYERTQGGRKAVMLSGQILGAAPSAPYGHMFIGEKKGKLMIRNEEEAAVILLMRDWVLNDGYGTPTIARLLNERFIPTPGRAANWMAGVVYHILTDHSIAGTYYHNRFRRNKRGDKYPARTDPSEWIPIAIEEIITKEDFDAIQKKLASNRQLSTRNSKYFYLLGRRIFCSCGRSMSGDIHGKHRVYRCTGSKSIAPNQCRPTVCLRCDVVDPFVWEWIVTQLEPETLRLGLLAEREKSAQTLEELTRQKAMYQTQMKELSSRLDRIQQGFNGGFYTLEEALAQKAQVAPAVKSVEVELEKIETTIAEIARNTEDDEALIAEAEELHREAEEITEPEKKRKFIDRLDTRITITRKDNVYTAHMECILSTKTGIVSSPSR